MANDGTNLDQKVTLWRGRVVLEDRVVTDGAVVTSGSEIVWVGEANALPQEWAYAASAELPEKSLIMPGLIDVHCHGGGGASFPDSTSLEDVTVAAQEHLKQGTTTLIASLVTAPLDVLVQRANLLAEAVQSGIIEGIHYEGPFLSEARCGAQDPRYLIPATPEAADQLVEAAGGFAVSMTFAPERAVTDQGRRAVEILAEGGILPSWGHTDSGIADAETAVEMGVRDLAAQKPAPRGGRATVTHLFNGMRPLHHREPGPITVFLEAAQRGEVVVEMINDGVHLDPSLVRKVVEMVGRENAVFVTDAMAAAGMEDGSYVLGPQEVRVQGGVARLAHGNAIAGGTARLLDIVRVAVQRSGLEIHDAVFMASTQGARILGLKDRGLLKAGLRADLVIVDDNMDVLKVVREGRTVA